MPPAKRYAPAGFYPASYGIRWDEPAGEYRIALQGLSLAGLSACVLGCSFTWTARHQ